MWEEFAEMTKRFIKKSAVNIESPKIAASDVYREILANCLDGRNFEFRHAMREFDAFGDEQLNLSDGWQVVTVISFSRNFKTKKIFL